MANTSDTFFDLTENGTFSSLSCAFCFFTPLPEGSELSHSAETSQRDFCASLSPHLRIVWMGLKVPGWQQMTNVTTGKAWRGAIGCIISQSLSENEGSIFEACILFAFMQTTLAFRD